MLLQSIASTEVASESAWLEREQRWEVGGNVVGRFKSMTPRHRILLADETDIQRWAAYLSSLDCDTKVVMIADVLDCVAEWQPDLVLLDSINSGFDICRQIKQNGGSRKSMVLMVTQLNELDDIERAVEAGVDDFLSKPVNENEFLKRVENLLKLSRV